METSTLQRSGHDRTGSASQAEPLLDRELLFRFLSDRGADQIRHSSRSFLDHLQGVEALLRSWGEPEPVVLAGLFHSVYGTEAFKRALLRDQDRGRVRALIGERAERLTHLYGGMRIESLIATLRPNGGNQIQTRWQAEPVVLDDEDLRAIASIFVANWLEQFSRMRGKSRAARMETFRYLSSWLGGPVGEAIDQTYGFGQKALEVRRPVLRPDAEDHERIEIWDDAVPNELMVQLAGLVDQNIWRYGWKASQEQTSYGFWHSHFGGDDDHNSRDCIHDLVGRPLVKPVLDLWRTLEAGPLKGQIPVRIYANGHTFGGDGHLHRDHNEPGHFTTIYYAHPHWEPNWAGETVFFNEADDDVIRAVYPKPGRLAHFPGYIQHAARSPGRECSALRAVIVLKSRWADPEDRAVGEAFESAPGSSASHSGEN